jgi:hypothetical protein
LVGHRRVIVGPSILIEIVSKVVAPLKDMDICPGLSFVEVSTTTKVVAPLKGAKNACTAVSPKSLYNH